VKLPPSVTPQALRAGRAPAADPVSFARHVRAGVADWVRTMVAQAASDMESPALRNAVAGDRSHTSSALSVLQGRRELLVDRLVHALHQALDEGERSAGTPEPEVDDETRPLKLTLIDEAQIDEDIEIARIVQSIESEADGELHQLVALCSGLRGLPGIAPEALPLAPLACAGALRAGLAEMALEAGPRLLLLRQLGSALGRQMRKVYAEQAELLTGWGVKPAPFRVKLLSATTAPGAAPDPASMAALWRLVERARNSLQFEPPAAAPAQAPEDVDPDAPVVLRLFDDPLPADRTPAPLAPAAAVQLMERLFAQIEQHLPLSPAARELLSGLHEPGRALAAQEAQLWTSPDHPWWTFLDRLITLGSVHDEGDTEAAGVVTQSLGLVVERMRQSPTLDRVTCQTAVDDIHEVATRAQGLRSDALSAQVGEIQHQADQQDTEIELRNQIVQQLRSTPVCPGLRQFLLGPWTQAMTQATLQHGLNSPVMDELALVVDDLIRVTSQPGKPVSRAQQNVLLRQVSEGLAASGLPPSRLEAEVADLKTLMRNPPAVQEEAWQGPEDREPTSGVMDLQAGLPTVPIAMGHGADSTMEEQTMRPWLDGLEAGQYCRLFLLGRWMTTQLSWVSPTHNLFLFSSRHGGRTHSLTRRMLEKLRGAGLATSIEDGALLAQALNTLADTDFGSV